MLYNLYGSGRMMRASLGFRADSSVSRNGQPHTCDSDVAVQGTRTMEFKIVAVPQGSLHKYWKAMQAGAEKAVRDLQGQGVTVNFMWKAPLREDDRQEQTKILETVLRQQIDGIILAPFDSRTFVPLVESAAAAKIPTVIVDSALESTKILSFIATDNLKAGALAADRMGEVLAGHGKVLLLRYQEGSASTAEREEGFRKRLAHYPEIKVVL